MPRIRTRPSSQLLRAVGLCGLGLSFLAAEDGDTDPPDPAAELAELRERVAQGEARAMRELGQAYQYAKFGLTRNLLKALELYHEAAELGEPMAINNIGQIHQKDGKGTTAANVDRAIPWLERAADLDVPHANATLASIYWFGGLNWRDSNGERNPQKAEEFAKRAIALGEEQDAAYGRALGSLVLACLRDEHGGATEEEIARLYLTAADIGHYYTALRQVAERYLDGLGLEKSPENAIPYAELMVKYRLEDAEELLARARRESASASKD